MVLPRIKWHANCLSPHEKINRRKKTLQILLNGLIQGALFALMGLAFSLVYSTTRVLHVALGAIYALAPYILLASLNAGLGWGGSLILAIGFAVLAGMLCEEILHWPFLRRGAPPEVHLIGSLGMFLVLVQVIAILWGNDVQVLRNGVDTVYSFGDLRLTRAQVLGGAGAVTVISSFFLWLRRTELGMQFRAMADNPVLLSLLGRDVRKLRRLVFGMSAGLVALASLGSAYDTGFDPHGGLDAVLVGIVATIVGGRGSLAGAVLAGLLLGVIRSEVVLFASARWEQAATFAILALILFFRPQGLFGRMLRLEERA